MFVAKLIIINKINAISIIFLFSFNVLIKYPNDGIIAIIVWYGSINGNTNNWKHNIYSIFISLVLIYLYIRYIIDVKIKINAILSKRKFSFANDFTPKNT